MVWLILLCSLILAAIDYRVARRVVGGQGGNALKRVVVPLWVLDFMPQILSCIFFLFFRDNPTWLMKFNCWAFLFYLMAAVARAPLGLAILISKSRLVRIAGGAVWAARVVVMAHGVVIESDRVPESFSGYRILQLSDLHIGTMLNPEKQISELAELCNQEAADMITMCGDLVNIRYEELTPSITEALQKFEARDGIYSIIGNHDVGVYIKDSITFTPDNNTRQLILRQKSLGWNVLDNSSEKIYRGGDSIFVTSITYEKELQDHRHSRKLPEVDFAAAYKGVDSGCFTITLSHIPQLWDKILSESQADLTLAGHVHAMQIKLPIGGRGLSPSVLLYKRWSGLYEEQGRELER